jgi:hypothetical protein
MLAEFEAPSWEAPAVGLIAGATATVFSAALDASRNAGRLSEIDFWIQQAHIARSECEFEQGQRRQAQMEIANLREQLAEAENGLAQLALAMRK